jgi:Protein of unknown function (DUF2934)
MSTTGDILDAARVSLSPARLSTYEIAAGAHTADDPRALALYAWNARLSAALLAPLHICEVVIRNSVADALEAVYGPRWPWDKTFAISLPNPSHGYSPRRDLQAAAAIQPTTGKAIPELKFIFWQEMFTGRHDGRLWNAHLMRVFPSLDATRTIVSLRREFYADLEGVRRLRNRIAHHEPVFTRDLAEDFQRMVKLVERRSPLVASWMVGNQDAVRLISEPPVFRGGRLWKASYEEIAQFAYRLWCDEGMRNASADQDWVAAERMLGIIE